MAKDPAFLFYSTLFYEGTRMMLPEERACYIDLMIYQHQNGPIPNDIKRVLMYCSGIDEATLEATLKAKFKLTSKGWVNEKLNEVISERAEYRNKQSINGTIGQFWKKCKAILTKKEYEKLRKQLEINDKEEFYEFIKDKEINEDTLEGLLKALLKHYIKDTIKDIDTIKDKKGGVEEKKEIEFPYDSEKFKQAWGDWLEYKLKNLKFRYKTSRSEQIALNQLYQHSKNEAEAIDLIHRSIANGWKGLVFETKTNQNGRQKPDPRFDDRRSKFVGASKRRGTVKFT